MHSVQMAFPTVAITSLHSPWALRRVHSLKSWASNATNAAKIANAQIQQHIVWRDCAEIVEKTQIVHQRHQFA
jgi:hypothetical protein